MTRDEAFNLLHYHVKNSYQRLHSKMVARCMEACAEKFGESKDLWFITGLLHDLDYDEFPDQHPVKSLEWLREMDTPAEIIHAIEAHAYGITGVEPKTKLAATLIAVDELSGFLYAYSLMRPEKWEGMKGSKAVKKLKDPSFAAKISREDIYYGAEKMEIDLVEHTQFLIDIISSTEDL